MKNCIEILSIPIDPLDNQEVMRAAEGFLDSKTPHQIVTVNAEFLVHGQYDPLFKTILKHSALNTADGIGVLWASAYLALPVADIFFIRWLQSAWQILLTGTQIIFSSKKIKTKIPEKISGVDLIWSLAGLAARKNSSLYLLGGFEDTARKVGDRLKSKFPNLRLAGSHAGYPGEPGLIDKIKADKPDILMVAFGPVSQEKWIAENLEKLQIPLIIGLGGTFDYISDKKRLAPRFLRQIGLEWAFRLLTQPYRLLRIFKAVPVFIYLVAWHKILLLRPYRRSIAACFVDEQNRILICRRTKKRSDDFQEHWQLPQGGVEPGESDEQAIRREMKEELGIFNFSISEMRKDLFTYDWPIPFAKIYQNRYRGQILSVAYASIGHDVAQNITPDNREFDAYQWAKKEDVLDLVHPIHRDFAVIVLKGLNGL